MLIRSATERDREAIYYLWKDCFSDPNEYIDFFMKKRFRADFCAILEENREVVGMIHLLPCLIEPKQKALYWYAAGIRSDYRNKGLFRKFSIHVKKEANNLGYRNLCVPAQGLEEFYKSIGFSSEYVAEDKIFDKDDLDNSTENNSVVLIKAASSTDFLESADSSFGNTIWDEKAIEYAIIENKFCNGKSLKFQFNEKTYAFFAIQKDNEILIDYHNIPDEVFLNVKQSIFDVLKTERLVFRTFGNQKIVGLSDSEYIDKKAKISMTLA